MVRVISESVSRRRVLLAVAAAPLAVACTTEPPAPPPPDPLSALAAQARSDAALAALLTAVPAAAEVAKARGTHAELLQAEVDRERPPLSSTVPPVPSTPPQPPNPVAALRTALDEAVRAASEAVPKLPSHRAGLVGSVAAGCASLREVLA
ncbi:hypothetical protein ADL03_17340 [Nocardia sp. NRRL S-836]|nr:hypothetical protein ADL03_17340 [Nocardia sp. NRRL S-836]